MWVFLCICLVSGALAQNQTNVPTVNITQGTVIGSVAESGGYYEFYGIPYADSTSGSHRFKAPNPAPSFNEPFVANRRGVKCITATGNGFEGTEDCLVLNIFTKSLESKLPVMVWIKGKEFDKVIHEFSFRKFVEKDVVVVELNFRESIFGFLCLGTETAPGNAGLKDIVAGLRWVQQNIERFGGDPGNVSIFGHGSGAATVDLITLSNTANGLVHKAIAQSGIAMAPWAVTRNHLAPAIRVAEGLGHVVTSSQQLSEIFERTSVAALMAVINELDLTDNSLPFAPCVENPSLVSVEPFMIKTPQQIINDNEFQQIPFMTSFVDQEGTIREDEANDWIIRMDSSFSDFLPVDLQFANNEEKDQIANTIRSFYFDVQITLPDYIKYHGDTMVLVSTLREAIMRSSNSAAPIYVYQISYDGELGKMFLEQSLINSAKHGEELAYLFYDAPDTIVPDVDLTIADILIERWTNFAKTGQPTSETSLVDWNPFTLDNPVFLRLLDAEEVVESNFEIQITNGHQETLSFWDSIYSEHFLDGELNWDSVRDDDNNDITDDETESPPVGVVTPGTNDGDNESSPGPNDNNDNNEASDNGADDSDGDGEPNSASILVSSTILIVTVFHLFSVDFA